MNHKIRVSDWELAALEKLVENQMKLQNEKPQVDHFHGPSLEALKRKINAIGNAKLANGR